MRGSTFQRAGHAIADGEQREIDALVGLELGAERADRLSVLVLFGQIGDPAAPQDVVDQDDAAAPHELEATLVVGVVVVLVGVDEGKVELAGQSMGQQPVECLERRSERELDTVGEARCLPGAGLGDRIELTIAPALKTLDWLLAQGLTGQLDLAFIDANKNDYDAYYERCLKLVRRGGISLVDNVLWGGRVANLAEKDEDTKAIRALNAKLKADERVDLALFAVGDGMTCALKR